MGVYVITESIFFRCLWATGTTISCSQGKQYRSVLSLHFLDIFGPLAQLLPAAWQQRIQASAQSTFLRCLWSLFTSVKP